MGLLDTAFSGISSLKLWYNTRSGVSIKLSDMPEIIPLRWAYFRDNWEFIHPILEGKALSYQYPDEFNTQIKALSQFIEVQRNGQNKNINPFSKSSILTDYYLIWDNMEVNSIPLTRQEQGLVQDKISKVQRFIKTDFLKIRKDIVAARDEIADTTGTDDSQYNAIFHRSSGRTLRDVKINDITTMQTLQNGIKAIDFILANSGSLNTVNIDPFALARANANNPDINIQTGRSGRLVRMFFGDSLESLAYRYLGDPDRWMEIAIANGLKAPYIDEIGTSIPLISNGSGNQINVAATDTNGNRNKEKFYINQAVFLQSDTTNFPDQRIIVSIKEIPISGELVIELDGSNNLQDYTTIDNAYVRVFKPNTINSNFMVLIPSPNSPDTTTSDDTPFFLASKQEDEKRAGVDLAINDSGDIVFTSSGDLQLSFGLANAIQSVQLKMLSEKGQNPRHPSYGLPNVVGIKTNQADIIKQTLITNINNMINIDARFDRVETIDVKIDKRVAKISMVVRMAGSGTLVPISFTVNAG